MSEKRLQWTLFALVSFVVWLIYFKTTAPTVVFWDVGEFLATSAILGIPHPPGTPLYVILGKFMTLLPLPLDFLYKLINGVDPRNLVLKITSISITTGALTAGFVYLLIVKTLNLWNRELPRPLVHLSGIFGALIGALASTVWFNSTEAETYTPANFIILLTAWLAFEWWERKDDPKSLAILIFIGYVTSLFSGIHLGALVGFPAILLFIFVVKRDLLWDVKLVPLISVFFLLVLATKLSYEPTTVSQWLNVFFQAVLFAYLYVQRDLDFNDTWVIVMGIAFAGTVFGVLTHNFFFQIAGSIVASIGIFFKDELYRDWRGFAFIMMFLAFTTELFLIIRAKWGAMHPELLRINEAEPDDWRSFLDVLTRKQYEPMKLFPRRIPFMDQLSVFWLYYSWQYGRLLLPVTLLAVLGILTHFANERKTFVLLGGLLVLGTLGLLIYLNLKDSPSHPINPMNPKEVRDRDYFFALGYTMIGLYAGIGLYEVMRLIWANLRLKVLSYAIGIVVAIGLVGWQFAWAFPYRDRSHNFIAEDYAYNMLISPQGRSVMFTNGDNDTFPLWFDQEALGIRRDVIIANLSLLNTNWYVRQLKGWGAPISFTPEEIDKLLPVYPLPNGKYMFLKDLMIRDMIATSAGYQPSEDEYVTLPGGVRVPKIYFASKQEFLKEVIEGADFKMPIYFAITVSRDNMRGWEDYLLMEGLAFRLVNHKVGLGGGLEGINAEYTRRLLHDDMPPDSFLAQYAEKVYPDPKVFRYRGVFNPRVWKDATHEKLIRNYASVSLRLSLYYDNLQDTEKSAEELALSRRFLDQLNIKQDILNQILAIDTRLGVLYRELGQYEKSVEAFRHALDITENPIIYKEMAKSYVLAGDTAKAIEQYEIARSMAPNDREVILALSDLYRGQGRTSKADSLLQGWLARHPKDSTVLKKLQESGE